MKAIDPRQQTHGISHNTSVDPRTLPRREVRLYDLWSPPDGVSLGDGAIVGGRVYRLILNTYEEGEPDYTEWEGVQDYESLYNVPNFYSWTIVGEVHPFSPSDANAVHEGKAVLHLDISGHDLLDRTHQEITGMNLALAIIFNAGTF